MATNHGGVMGDGHAVSRIPDDGMRPRGTSVDELRGCLIGRLRSRQVEVEGAIVERLRVVEGPLPSEDEELAAGRRVAVSAGVHYFLTGFEYGAGWAPPPLPSVALAQVRRAARYGMSADTNVRALLAAHRLFGQAVASEGARAGFASSAAVLLELRSIQEALMLEHWVPAYVAHHVDECEHAARSPEQRRLELVQRLLALEPVDPAELCYDLKQWHVGVIARGKELKRALSGVAAQLGLECLAVSRSENAIWAWLGAERGLPVTEIERLLPLEGISYAIGEPGHGIAGWRLTHEQAQAALSVALYRPQGITRCSDVSLEAALLRDEGLRTSLLKNYLLPLGEMRIGDRAARDTLRAWIDCERNASSAACRLGVTRHTVEKRLRDIEAALGRPLGSCMAELEVALRLEAITG
jgi:PucR C-terminal helix-turn-helix domain/GGDEF-like domain